MTPSKGPRYNATASTRTASSSSTRRCATASSRPGISLNVQEKLEIAHQLARLGVDVIEAGFPITSPGDFEAVEAIAREVEGPVICGLARTVRAGHRRRLERDQALRAPAHPHLHRHLATSTSSASCRRRARTSWARRAPRSRTRRQYCDDVEFSPEDGSRSDVEFMAEVVQVAIDEGATTINIPDTVGYTMPHEYARDLRASCTGWCPELKRRRRLGPLPRRPRAGGRQLVRRPAGRRAPGRVRGERHRRARRQRLARGDRDAAAHARARASACDTGIEHAGDRAHEPPGLAPDRLPGAAEQGDRRPQRVRARGRASTRTAC